MGNWVCLDPTVPNNMAAADWIISVMDWWCRSWNGATVVYSTPPVCRATWWCFPIYAYGSGAHHNKIYQTGQRQWLELFWFNWTNHGSDPLPCWPILKMPATMWLLLGGKMWINNAYAGGRCLGAMSKMKYKGLIVERGMEGFSTPLRMASGACVPVPRRTGIRQCESAQKIWTNVKGLKGPLSCLKPVMECLGAVGVTMDCYDTALRYSKERIRLANHWRLSAATEKLAGNGSRIARRNCNWRLGSLMNEGKVTRTVSMANNACEIATNVTRDAARCWAAWVLPAEILALCATPDEPGKCDAWGHTRYPLLITGMDVTGFNAFK